VTATIFSRFITPKDRKILAAIKPNDFTNEINLLKVHLARYLETCPPPEADFKTQLTFIRTLTLAFSHLGRLLSAHLNEKTFMADYYQSIEDGTNDVRRELGILDWDNKPPAALAQLNLSQVRESWGEVPDLKTQTTAPPLPVTAPGSQSADQDSQT
jgi:hypothetical protein